MATKITVAHGDGIGPEIMEATLRILNAAGAALDIHTVEMGEKAYLKGAMAGLGPEVWESLRETQILLKAPMTTPQGGGYKSLNVTLRKTLGMYANVRPCRAYSPFVKTLHPKMDLVIIRENEEDLYAGIEHRQTHDVYQCLKLITRPGCEKITRYAFEYARRYGRKKVTCFSKDNIMKMTDGLFHKVFQETAQDYPEIQNEHLIVDIGAARLADTPEIFDVVVMPNLYGDILSDVAAQIAGSVGLAGSSNIGNDCAMFEAIHGSAPDIAGQGIANPSGLLLSSVMMLLHIGQSQVAETIHNAWLSTLEAGIHTRDLFDAQNTRESVGTEAFTNAVIERLGSVPQHLAPVSYKGAEAPLEQTQAASITRVPEKKVYVGVDLFLDWQGQAEDLGQQVAELGTEALNLTLITNRGIKVWPQGNPATFCTDHWRLRFLGRQEGQVITHTEILEMYEKLTRSGFDVIKTENLCTFDGAAGYSMGQGQ
ncbi:MAG: NADP-dependent isocitrate dehydrogenase [Candidatus Sericytochromatia bacterium]